MDLTYEQSTRKPASLKSEEVFPSEFSREHLVQLLIYLEGEVQVRDQAIKHLKEDKTKLLLFEAKYGKLCPGDPLHALSRDSQNVPETEGLCSIEELYHNQMDYLDRLISSYKDSLHTISDLARSTEHRYGVAVKDLDVERKWKEGSSPNEAILSLKEENKRLELEIDRYNNELKVAKEELTKAQQNIESQSDKHEKIIVFLMHERKELLSTMAELQLRKKNPGPSAADQSNIIEEMRREMDVLINERDSLKNSNKAMKGEIIAYKERMRKYEEDELLRKNSIGGTKGISIDRNMDERCMIVSNRLAMTAPPSSSSRPLPSSSSFPSERSKLPRAPSSPSTNNTNILSNTKTKKTPAMGLSTVRRVATAGKRSALATDDVISTDYGNRLLRSSSLTRESSTTTSSIRPSTLPKGPSNGPNVSPISSPSTSHSSSISRLPSKSDPKSIPQPTKTKNSLLRAFGK